MELLRGTVLFRGYVWNVLTGCIGEYDKTIQWLINKPNLEILKELGLFGTDEEKTEGRGKTILDRVRQHFPFSIRADQGIYLNGNGKWDISSGISFRFSEILSSVGQWNVVALWKGQ